MISKKRVAISPKTRFEVLKRDAFTCQYCGQMAPDVVLHVDHIDPVAEGGSNQIINLVTACQTCNGGKGARKLSDDSALAKQQAQLAELQERRNQLELMAQWRAELDQLENEKLSVAVQYWDGLTPGWQTNARGKALLAGLLKKNSPDRLFEAMRRAADTYIELDASGQAVGDSVHVAFNKITGILRNLDSPGWLKAAFYANGILRNRLTGRYYNQGLAIGLLKGACSDHLPPGVVVEFCKTINTWSEFKDGLAQMSEQFDALPLRDRVANYELDKWLQEDTGEAA